VSDARLFVMGGEQALKGYEQLTRRGIGAQFGPTASDTVPRSSETTATTASVRSESPRAAR